MENKILEYTALKWTFKVPKDCFYVENDFWVQFENQSALVGITDYVQIMMGDIIFVETKEIGTNLDFFDEIASIESTKTMVDLLSPVAGEIEQINQEIIAAPYLLNEQPYGKNWIVKIKINDLNSAKEFLIDAQEYYEILKRKVDAEKDKLGKELE